MPGLGAGAAATVAEEIWQLLAYLAIRQQEFYVRTAAELGLTPPQAHLLLELAPGEPISQREVSRRLHCAPSSVVDHIDRLEEDGLLERRVGRADRRVNTLVVTERGEEVRQKLGARLYRPPAVLDRLAASDQILVRDLLRGLLGELDATAPGGTPRECP
jgi:DNA-binding MarR family transcriptional regulator